LNCPISFNKKIDSDILRINSFFYLLFIIITTLTHNYLFIVPLIIIFISKNINIYNKCFIDEMSIFFKVYLFKKTNEKLIDPAPKKIANMVGLFGSIMIFITMFLNLKFYFIPLTIMGIAMLLELILEYCVGCKIYHLYNKLLNK